MLTVKRSRYPVTTNIYDTSRFHKFSKRLRATSKFYLSVFMEAIPLCLLTNELNTCNTHLKLTNWIKINLCWIRLSKCSWSNRDPQFWRDPGASRLPGPVCSVHVNW
jgi:hypothetical protein